jgi:EmrB/QacA subfamily drug resistance transporter
MRQPCDEAVIRSGAISFPCRRQSQPWVLAATILASSMAFVDSTVVNVALPSLQSSLHATAVDVQWVIESYGLFLSALILAGGALGDSFGRRLVFLLGVGLFVAASIACGFSSNVGQLVLARTLQGIGAALLVPGSLAIISACFDEKSRGQAIGTWSGFTAITTALGPVLGGWLIEHASWRWVFFINVPLAIAVIVISLWHVPESRSAVSKRVDWLGALTATAGIGGLVFGLLETNAFGWTRPVIVLSLLAGLACLVGFFFVETKVAKSPLVPTALFRSRWFSAANLLTLLLYSALGIFFFLFPMRLIQVQGYSAIAAGAAALPMILLMFFLSRWSGGLVSRFGPRLPLIIGPLIVATGFALFVLPSTGGSYWRTFFPGFVVLGLGMSVSVAPLTTVVMGSVERDHAGTASGINNAVARVAGVLAIAVLGLVMVITFRYRLLTSLAALNLAPGVIRDVQSNAIKLAGLELPAGLEAATATAIRTQVANSFTFGFRVIMLISSGLTLASSGVVLLMTPPAQAAPSKD